MSYTESGSGPTTSDERLNAYVGQYQKALDDRFKDDPVGERPLMAMANKNVIREKGKNEVTIYTRPFVRVRRSTLDANRQKSTGNYLTTDATKGGNIASVAVNLKLENFKIQDSIDFAHEVDLTLGIDNAVNNVQVQSKLSHDVYKKGRELAIHEIIMRNCLLADNWLNNDAAVLSLSHAVTLGATTFKVTNAHAANFVAERFTKIGNHKIANSTGGVELQVDVVMIKTVGAADSGGAGYALMTIETDTANFPLGAHFDAAGEIFELLQVSLSAHDAGVLIQTDKPIFATGSTIDSLVIRKIKLAAQNAYIDPTMLVLYQPPEATDLMESHTSPFVTNDLLGKEILTTGRIGRVRGMSIVDEADAVKRVMPSGQTTYYIWAFERGECYVWVEYLRSRSIAEKIQQRAGLLLKDSYFEVLGSHTPRSGKIRSILVPVVLETEVVD